MDLVCRIGMSHTYARDLRSTVRHKSPLARKIAGAVMESCKICRWDGARLAARDIAPGGLAAELYSAWAEHEALAALAEGKPLDRVVTLATLMGRRKGMLFPPTPDTFELCTITVDGVDVSVDVSRVLEHLRGLTYQERVWVMDDVLSGIVGAEFYPPAPIEKLLTGARSWGKARAVL
ncbi:hypothetical protein JCM3263A_22290 [Thermobifida fusca]|jgi:hypothetical protein|uniref:Uncharacterized protein n=3 Tax=Nocardiopsidaceae TaxID=83676 RepID=A0A9P2T6J7_THEFU|nr:hypothetical protein Tfu_2952 [Thermobifida fusca YX]EOR69896.1 hypothetical protein TM51_15141 [Thermobifida fusca TM51]MBO2530035.1 hypothetical protein [Thermobifida sp.]PPS94919.1 hypothetical protein BH05_03985 [Thermobifida fusca]PZN65735.1 MAG: hypothetical protein DIU53_03310 [Thermobifida fusca]